MADPPPPGTPPYDRHGKKPTADVWKANIPLINELNSIRGPNGTRKKTFKAIAAELRRQGLNVNDRVVRYQVHDKNGVRTNLKAETKELYGIGYAAWLQAGNPVDCIDPDILRRVIRHYRDRKPRIKSIYEALLRIDEIQKTGLSQSNNIVTAGPSNAGPSRYSGYHDPTISGPGWAEETLANSPNLPVDYPAQGLHSRPYTDPVDVPPDRLASFGSDLQVFEQQSTVLHPYPLNWTVPVSHTVETGAATQLVDVQTLVPTTASNRVYPTQHNPVPETINHLPFRGTTRAFEELIHIVGEYYVGHRGRSQQPFHTVPDDTTRKYWQAMKTAIYCYKDRGEQRADRILSTALDPTAQVCSLQSLTLLRHLLGTLSPANTAIRPGLRTQLLNRFASHFNQPGTLERRLYTICWMLTQDWVSDVHIAVILTRLIRLAANPDGSFNPEVAELHRARIELLRRSSRLDPGLLLEADMNATDSLDEIGKLAGDDSEQARKIMSEKVHIHKARGEFDEGLRMALDIVGRAKRAEKNLFPSQRAIWDLENVAELAKLSGNWGQALAAMRQAMGAASRQGHLRQPNHESNAHLQDKFAVLKRQCDDLMRSIQIVRAT